MQVLHLRFSTWVLPEQATARDYFDKDVFEVEVY